MEFGKFLCGQQTLGGGSPSRIKGLNGVEGGERGRKTEGERRRAWGLGLAVLLGRPCVSANSISLSSSSCPPSPLSHFFPSNSIFNEINN